MEGTLNNDPLWRLPSASLRKGQLYFKAPISFVLRLVMDLKATLGANPDLRFHDQLQEIYSFLEKEALDARGAGQSSVVISLEEAVAVKDLEALTSIPVLKGHMETYASTLRRGLASEAEVDWISRVGGPSDSRNPAPRPAPSGPRLELVEITEEEIQSLFE